MTSVLYKQSDYFYWILIMSIAVHMSMFAFSRQAQPVAHFSVQQAKTSIPVSIVYENKQKPVEPVENPDILPVITTPKQETPPVRSEQPEMPIEKAINNTTTIDKATEKTAEKEPIELVQEISHTKAKENVTAKTSASQGAIHEAKPLTHINPSPQYPHAAKRRGWEGIVQLKVSVNKNGKVTTIVIDQGSGYSLLDRTALATVKQWQFEPAIENKKKVSSTIIIPVEFKLLN